MNTLLLTTSVDIFLVEDMFEMFELLDGMGLSVIPVCSTSDRNSKDSCTTNS